MVFKTFINKIVKIFVVFLISLEKKKYLKLFTVLGKAQWAKIAFNYELSFV